MEKRRLGKSDLEMALLAFGGNVFGFGKQLRREPCANGVRAAKHYCTHCKRHQRNCSFGGWTVVRAALQRCPPPFHYRLPNE